MSELKLLQTRLDGRYEIQRCLGSGSYAEIYVARDLAPVEAFHQEVVIKALNVLLQGVPDTELERTLIENFQNEAVALDRVRHPHVINRLGHGTAIDLAGHSFHYLVLEYLSGGDMAALCRGRKLHLERTLFYLEQVCAGLAHAHSHNVIHRDIKPQNLLLTANCEVVKIADFGVAKIELGDEVITRVGTNIYAAPEHNPLVQTGQLDTASLPMMRSRLTPAADIYSLAKTTYAILTGEAPRRFAQHSISELPASVNNEFWSDGMLRVLRRATQSRPDDRYQTVQEFWEHLRDAALPPTQLLNSTHGPHRRPSADLGLETVVVPQAPPRPAFELTSNLPAGLPGNGTRRGRIVVPVAGRPMAPAGPRPTAGEIIAAMPNAPVARKPAPGSPVATTPRRSTTILVAIVLIGAFAAMLYATQKYIRSRWTQPTTVTGTVTPTLIGREAVTITDLNLRSGPSSVNDAVGLAEQGSRVRILSAGNNWCEVLVIQHGRLKDDPGSSDRGWVNRRYLRFD